MLFTPTFNGNAIFGLAVHIQQVPDEAVCQLDAFFGVPGLLGLFGNTRGRTFHISGALFDSSPVAVSLDKDIFLPGTQYSIVGQIGTLFDTLGDTWLNVIYLGHFQADANGPKPAVTGDSNGDIISGWAWPYQCVFRGLS
jgi:hypothetical protein